MPLEGPSPDWVQQPTNQNENEALKKLDISFKLKVMSKVFAADTLCCIACEQRRFSDSRFSLFGGENRQLEIRLHLQAMCCTMAGGRGRKEKCIYVACNS